MTGPDIYRLQAFIQSLDVAAEIAAADEYDRTGVFRHGIPWLENFMNQRTQEAAASFFILLGFGSPSGSVFPTSKPYFHFK